MFKLELEYKNGILFARLKGILNRKNSYKINNYLNPVIKKHEIKYLVYNFEDLEMIDNSGIDALINSKYYIKCNKGVIKVCGVHWAQEYLCKYLKLSKVRSEIDAFIEMEAM